MSIADRLLTIVVTATLTSAAWIVAGSSLVTTSPASGEEPSAVGQAGEAPSVPLGAAVASPHRREIAGGERPGDRELLIPVEGIAARALTDTFADPRGGGTRLHEALDIMAPRGTAVVAAAPGTIERLFVSGAGGNTIYLRSTDRETIHYYAHLDAYAPGLREGQRVARGERLGTVGSTGNAAPDAPHLHFAVLRTTPDAEWWEPATALNPFPLLAGRR
jgi:murein DD-endopeptidase MepM/ murein hydrolase activator NlpD